MLWLRKRARLSRGGTFLRATTGGKGSKGGRKGRSKEAKQAAAQQTAAEVRYATEFQEALENGGALPNYESMS